ncbi:MAG: response regulator [Spirochaetes bacterium]|nr:response regulator [Spirochaetota bacterium]NLJ05099.1 response regulator [Exilispira sp.]MBP8991193.1 response regulator [Spirochaetota bacterium]HOV46357.1 chemotaxis protein CheB [Exilispira sp.]HPB47268.1 chemotaxis protein CheB [Exilispira sp.]
MEQLKKLDKIKVAIADDLDFFRKVLVDIFEEEEEFIVSGVYKNGQELIKNIFAIKPDIILTDFKMPDGDGLYVIEKINEMKYNIPVILISSYAKQDNEGILECLEKGAVDIIEKPTEQSFKASFDLLKTSLLKKIRYIYNNCVVLNQVKTVESKTTDYIAIGASTGGTKAIETIMRDVKRLSKTTIFISQHMPARYTTAFAQRLNSICSNGITEAINGEKIKSGHCYIAPGNFNLIFAGDHIELTDASKQIVSPGIDIMFQSFVSEAEKTCGILLTGMGSDGATGLKKLHDHGAITVVQDERSSVVYGMPKSAIEIFIVDYILPLNLIAGFINSISQ